MFEPRRRLNAHFLFSTAMFLRWTALLGVLALAATTAARADNARFDLIGPKVEVRVTRAGVTLPIASVPNLQPGDRLWLHPDLPATQSVHYLMVLAFLRGTTNPPPDNWFTRIETWDKKIRDEGVEISVPDEAQQAVLFLAPVTGGDFATLRSAVQGRPGIFVRASQDLNLAGFEQARIEKYIAAMREIPPTETTDPKALEQHSNTIAATLALKPNGDCTKLSPEQQYTCLTQSGGQSLLDDGHGQTIADALSTGPGSDFINQASYTQAAGGGLYSAYVGAIVDLVRIMGSERTAQYQYIPAITFPQQQALNLRLNTPPSFHNPKSVIVVGLPAVQSTTPPPLRPADPNAGACLAKPGVVLPVEGAPLVFSTGFAHDLVLHLNYPGASANAKPEPNQPQDIPLTADPYKGGLVLAPVPKRRALPPDKVSLPAQPATVSDPSPEKPAAENSSGAAGTAGLTGTVRGSWGFDPFTGPTMPIENAPGTGWKIASDEPLIAGKDQHVLLSSTGTACIQSIALDPPGKSEKETWKPAGKPNTVDLALNLSALPGHDPGTLHLSIHQYADPKADTVSLISYSEPAKLTALEYHVGDTTAVLTGTSLDQVRQVQLGPATFAPQPTANLPDANASLHLALASGASSPNLPAGDNLTAQVALKDGRNLTISATVQAARPTITLIGKADVPSESDSKSSSKPKPALAIRLGSDNDLPLSDSLLFSLKSAQPFARGGKIEIASSDGALHTTLSVANETLILEDPHTILAKLETLKAFGPSAFGPIRLRPVAPDGAAGDWLALVTLVRLPTLTGLSCPPVPPAPQLKPSQNADPAEPASIPATTSPAAAIPPTPAQMAPCTLTGNSLYLIDSLAADPSFTNPTRVPDGFVGSSLTVPPPTGALYYLRLRDDPAATNIVTLPAGPL
jgi:hypothetical protein